MGQVCNGCGGKGWFWNGHARIECNRCGGRGWPLPPDKRLTGTRPAPDPVKQR